MRFERNINNVKNFDFEGLDETYKTHMDLYSEDLESGIITFIKEYIGINGITIYKINDDGTAEIKTFSAQNGIISIPCNNVKK